MSILERIAQELGTTDKEVLAEELIARRVTSSIQTAGIIVDVELFNGTGDCVRLDEDHVLDRDGQTLRQDLL